MKKAPLHVTLRVNQPSIVDLTVGETVQLDQLRPTPHGEVPERHGKLLSPGTQTLHLDQGLYFFKTLSNSHLKVVCGGVDTEASAGDKDSFPAPPPKIPKARGDAPLGDAPRFTVE
jgi:hypothetical protein